MKTPAIFVTLKSATAAMVLALGVAYVTLPAVARADAESTVAAATTPAATPATADVAATDPLAAPVDAAAVPGPANPYGLEALWAQGDSVAKGTLMILGFMSMGTWYFLITKLIEQRRQFSQFNRVIKLFVPTETLRDGIAALPRNNTYRGIAEGGEEAVVQFSKGLSSEVTLSDWTMAALHRAVENLTAKLQGGLAFLATVGSTAPFVGLFGTVWGIYHALVAIGVSGQASIDKVAGPVGESLIMTAIGLAVAVPAVLGYNLLTRRNKAIAGCARRFATEVQLRILTGKIA
ncbi:MAG: MotA/TolQ/ExbB proton channel family protein [Parvibaculum sp.]|nr:MotA/TolQ/ExbB proton channel family protein [Parvibaculum sp.]